MTPEKLPEYEQRLMELRRMLLSDAPFPRALADEFALKLTCFVKPAVRRRLRNCGRSQGEADELTNEILLRFWDNDFRILRRWQQPRGFLTVYISFVSGQLCGHLLKLRRYRSRTEESTTPDVLENLRTSFEVIESILWGEVLKRVVDCLREHLKPDNFKLFEDLFLKERSESVQNIATKYKKTPATIYNFVSRLRRGLQNPECPLRGLL